MRAISNDSYSKGESDYSVTELLKPPQAVVLAKRHKDKLEDDVQDRLWSLYGQVAHLILERANLSDLSEKRFFAEFLGKTVSGQIDSLSIEGGVLSDWKFTTSWGFKIGKAPKPEFTAQLNMQLELLRRNDLDAQKLQIVGLLRDHSKLEAMRTEDYPKFPVVVQPIEMWSRERTSAFIEERVSIHEAAKFAVDDADLPECTEEEMWAKPTIYAVMKGQKAIRGGLQYTKEAADKVWSENPGPTIEIRQGERTRCSAYCSVASVCVQYQKFLKEKQTNAV
jgi:hypothetical protein